MVTMYGMLAGGFVLLILGGDWLVRGASDSAARLNISPMVIGLTIVGFGTSMAELVTSVKAALSGSPGIAIGNVVGSNIANTLLILGVAALLAPIAVRRKPFLIDGGMSALAAAACAVAIGLGAIDRVAGAALLAVLLIYLVCSAFRSPKEVMLTPDDPEAAFKPAPRPAWMSLGMLVSGVGLTVLSAHLLVEAGVDLAQRWGATEALIGLTVIAIGTSLPELATSLIAGLRGQSEIAFGNVIGSNIFNVFGILGVTAVISPIAAPAEIAQFDIWALLAATALFLAVALTWWRFTRMEGVVLIAAYAGYLAYKLLL